MSANDERCPLCRSANTARFAEDPKRSYLRCKTCSLVFVPLEFHVSETEERARYDQHENGPDNQGYRDFLRRIVGPLKERYRRNSRCLDFGCGPSPVLSEMLTEKGFRVTAYDQFYSPDVRLEDSYDVITATEVIEHLRRPSEVFERLVSKLNEGGTLAVMTGIRDESFEFETWHYKNDKTHICFYEWKTFEWIAKRFGLKAVRIESDIVFFERPKDEN